MLVEEERRKDWKAILPNKHSGKWFHFLLFLQIVLHHFFWFFRLGCFFFPDFKGKIKSIISFGYGYGTFSLPMQEIALQIPSFSSRVRVCLRTRQFSSPLFPAVPLENSVCLIYFLVWKNVEGTWRIFYFFFKRFSRSDYDDLW